MSFHGKGSDDVTDVIKKLNDGGFTTKDLSDNELAKAHASVPGIDELSCTLRELLPVPAAHGTFNVLLSNGQALWADGAGASTASRCSRPM
jgi:hypothetical protein